MSSRLANRVTSKWLSIVVFLCVLSVCGYVGQSYGQTVDLLPFLEKWQKQPVEITNSLSLKPEWIGTVKRAYVRDPLNIYKVDEVQHIRFNKIFTQRGWKTNSPLYLMIARVRSSASGVGHYIQNEGPIFYEKLPSVKQISEAENLAELKLLLGEENGFPDAWTAAWTCFTTEGTNRLRYLGVFAHVNKVGDEPKTVNIIKVTEGEFWPANPDSGEEKVKYKTGEVLYAEEVTSLKASWEKYPMPLRKLVAARQNHDDAELKAYKKELAAFRSLPDPLLIKQLVQQLHDDSTAEFTVMMDLIFAVEDLPGAPWSKETRRDAARLLAETLPDIKKADVLQKVIFKILEMQGGGKFKLEGKSSAWEIELSVELLENGHSTSYSASPRDSLVPQAALECLAELKRRYPELWKK